MQERLNSPVSIKDIIANYNLHGIQNVEGRVQEPWQEWFFNFCEKYSIKDKKEISRLISLVSKYRNALDWWRWLEGNLSDYPNLEGSPVGLVFFFFKKAKDEGKFNSVVLYDSGSKDRAYNRVRRDIRWYKDRKLSGYKITNIELIDMYRKHHERLIDRYCRSNRAKAHELIRRHRNVLTIIDKNYDRLKRGSYK